MGALGFTEAVIQRIHAHDQVIEIGLRITNDELAQAIIDLSRTCRREMLMIGVIPSYTEESASSYEMALTQHLMPEIASRLNIASDAPLILSRDEIGDGSASRLDPAALRKFTGQCWSRCDFARIGVAVRERFDPDGANAGKVFASEVIGREPCNGNLLEIALGRVAAPAVPDPSSQEDWFAERILHASRLRGLRRPVLVWTPEMRFGFHPEMREGVSPEIDPENLQPL